MSKVTVETPDGVTDEFVYACGITHDWETLKYVPGHDLKEHIENVRNLEIKDDDIYLATYPQCGTHWVWEILTMLRRGNAEYETKTKEAAFVDFQPIEEIKKIPSPRILNGHTTCKLTPKGIFEKGIKIIHVMRNPKDAFVSLYHHLGHYETASYTKSFQTFLPFMIGEYGVDYFYPWFKYVKEWEKFSQEHPDQILNLYYEDLKEDTVREVKKINSFLELDRDDALIEKIADACEIQKLRKADAEIKVKDGFMKGQTYQIYRKGQVGGWKNHFTVAQNEKIDEWLGENMIETNLKFRYTL